MLGPRVEQREDEVATEAAGLTILSTLTLTNTTVLISPTTCQLPEDPKARTAHLHDRFLTAKALSLLRREGDGAETELATTSTACLCQTAPPVCHLSRLPSAAPTNIPCIPCQLFHSSNPRNSGTTWSSVFSRTKSNTTSRLKTCAKTCIFGSVWIPKASSTCTLSPLSSALEN